MFLSLLQIGSDFIQIVSLGDNLHEMSNPIFIGKKGNISLSSEKYLKMLSAEICAKH